MNNRLEKSIRIVSELMLYCHGLGCTNCHIDFDLQPQTAYYEIRAPLADVDPAELERARCYLNQKRDPTMEQTYWMLQGQSGDQDQLMLVGMMVDQAEVEWENGELYIRLVRQRKTR